MVNEATKITCVRDICHEHLRGSNLDNNTCQALLKNSDSKSKKLSLHFTPLQRHTAKMRNCCLRTEDSDMYLTADLIQQFKKTLDGQLTLDKELLALLLTFDLDSTKKIFSTKTLEQIKLPLEESTQKHLKYDIRSFDLLNLV